MWPPRRPWRSGSCVGVAEPSLSRQAILSNSITRHHFIRIVIVESIKHTYTVQWVGPFSSYSDYRAYLNDSHTLGSDCFNIYYFEAQQDARYKWHRYMGIHKANDGIEKRLNTSHHHLKKFLSCKKLHIWIGSIADEKQQKPANIDVIETLLIRAYTDEFLTENSMKTRSNPPCSVCLINMWFDQNETMKTYRIARPFDDVIIYYHQDNIFKHGNLARF